MNLNRAWWELSLAGAAIELLALRRHRRETLSENVWRLAPHYPILAFAAGVICGHLFWQIDEEDAA